MRRTKIIATIGPACDTVAGLKSLFNAGVNACRLNFSFGTHAEHAQKIARIRQVSSEMQHPVAIIQDLQGPKIRVGKLAAPVEVKKGDKLILSGNSLHKNTHYLPTTYRNIADDTKAGKTILLADGKIILRVESVNPAAREVACKVIAGGTILTGKGLNLPYTRISLPALTPKDIKDAVFGIQNGIDYLALSFVRCGEDVSKLRRLLKKNHADIPIIAKLEKPEALDNLPEILAVADGVMVARGDLADEISFEHVPSAQKHIIKTANAAGKFTIVATEMLSSMIDNPLPTRAEVSDVANAVIDGSDMIMLSNETATGKYPAKAVASMAAIAAEAEKLACTNTIQNITLDKTQMMTLAMCQSAAFLSRQLAERATVVLTSTGETARIMAKCRPESAIYAATFQPLIYQQMSAYNNVTPILLSSNENTASMTHPQIIEQIKSTLLTKKLATPGEKLILLTGSSKHAGKRQLNSIHVITLTK
jgi:pyruvate kinase